MRKARENKRRRGFRADWRRSEVERSRGSFYASTAAVFCESLGKMCENRKPFDDVEAIREELSALIRLSNQKLDEMKQIQIRIDEVTKEIAQLTQQLEELGDTA